MRQQLDSSNNLYIFPTIDPSRDTTGHTLVLGATGSSKAMVLLSAILADRT
jgi:hypothetical protein